MTASVVARLIHVTDFHLGEQSSDTLLGVSTEASFEAVTAHLTRQHPAIDLIVASGDLANHGSAQAYRRLNEKMAALSTPVLYVPGNHDDVCVMAAELPLQAYPTVHQLEGWLVVGLNSAQAGSVAGRIDAPQLEALRDILLAQALPTVVVVHHPPVPVQSAWIDRLGLSEADAFLSLLAGFAHVKAVLCGHVHQDGQFVAQDVPIYTTPSTCVQFLPNSSVFAVDTCNPGYRWLDLYADGHLETGVVRIEGDYQADPHASGY